MVGHILHRQTAADLPFAVAGDGAYIVARDGTRYLDGSGGAAVSCLGHGDPDVGAAIKAQVDRLAFAHTGFFTTEVAEELADRLIAAAPAGLARVYFVSGGSEAMEAALKLARQYFLEIGEPDRAHFIARRQSYHGNTLGALSVGGNLARRVPYAPLLKDWSHVSPCFAYREQPAGESDDDYVARLAAELEAKILEVGPGRVAGFVAEPVVGATAGAVPPVGDYFKRIREVCDRHGVLLILDEVMCGMGRTGTLYACEQDGIAPDLLICAKGLGAGYQPIGAVILSGRIYQAIRDGSGAFQHGHTYMGHPTACAAALAVQKKIADHDLLARVRRLGAELDDALHERFGNHPNVGDIRGRGLFRALELVADRTTKAPFDAALDLPHKVKAAALARGLICYPGGGTIDGRRGAHVLLAPPFVIETGHIGELVDKLGGAIDAALANAT